MYVERWEFVVIVLLLLVLCSYLSGLTKYFLQSWQDKEKWQLRDTVRHLNKENAELKFRCKIGDTTIVLRIDGKFIKINDVETPQPEKKESS